MCDRDLQKEEARPRRAAGPAVGIGAAAFGGFAIEAAPHDIGWAVKQMHNGNAVTRRGWNGKGMYVAIQRPDPQSKMTLAYVFMNTAQAQRVPWLCSQADLLASDWEIAD